MAKLIIGFSKPKKFKIISWIIRQTEKTLFSHVYLKFHSDNLDRDIVYQASGRQVNFVGSVMFLRYHESLIEFELEINDNEKQEILKTCIDKAGIPYGRKQLIGLGLVRFLALFGKKIRNPFSDNDTTYICSELIGYILVKYFNFKIEDLDSTSPKDIYLLLQKYGQIRTT